MSGPVMLHTWLHPTHEDMADQIGAETVEADTGGPVGRVRSALRRDLSGRTVILEGGIPLSEALVMKITANAGRLVMLAADETLQNQATGLPYYTIPETVAHRVALQALDGVIALSPEMRAWADDRTGAAVSLAYPYLLEDRFEMMSSAEPDYRSCRGLFVGANRAGNNLDVLEAAAARANVPVDAVGTGTDERGDTGAVSYHGYVPDDELVRLINRSSFLVFPALGGAHPMVTVEAMAAGLAPITTYGVGTASHVQKVHPMLLCDPREAELARSLRWWSSLSPDQRAEIGGRAREVGSKFDPETGRAAFRAAYEKVLDEI